MRFNIEIINNLLFYNNNLRWRNILTAIVLYEYLFTYKIYLPFTEFFIELFYNKIWTVEQSFSIWF